MSKGKIVLTPFPFTDLSGNKVRPCLVLYEQKNGEDCIVSFLSSIQRARLGKFQLKIKATTINGLKKDSVLHLEKIATLQKKIILGELGTLEPTIIKLIDIKLKQLLNLR